MFMHGDQFRTLHGLLADACNGCMADTIALSGGLDSTILAYLLKEKKPNGIAVIADDFTATDMTYCQTASKALDINLHIANTGTTDILSAVDETIKILCNFNDIEIRNSIVIYLAIKMTRDRGLGRIVTGDGADELFAGYDFLLDKPSDVLEMELDRICRIMHFPAQIIGESLGITVESPFLDKNVVEFAKNIPANLKVREENGRVYGKWILRKAFEKLIPRQIAWRKKSPMQDGAGTTGLTGLFDSIIRDSDFEVRKKEIYEEDGVTIRTKESLHYYAVYRRIHGRMGKCQGKACPYCGHCTGDSKFCRMCGAFPI